MVIRIRIRHAFCFNRKNLTDWHRRKEINLILYTYKVNLYDCYTYNQTRIEDRSLIKLVFLIETIDGIGGDQS
jgi:hypothetical protein